MNQIFSAVPKNDYVNFTYQKILERMINIKPKCDYDILYIGANAFISRIYDQVGCIDKKVELVGYAKTKKTVRIHSMKSWRTD